MATDTVKTITSALEKGLAQKGEKVVVWADKSDYKDFIRMYVVSDFFEGMREKDRLGEIYSILDSHGGKSLIAKISLCIAMTKHEYDEEFGGDTWLGVLDKVYRGMSNRPKVRRLVRAQR